MKKLISIDYDNFFGIQGESIFEFWEKGKFPKNISTPSVSSKSYREMIIKLFIQYLPIGDNEIISLGAGNGFVESELMKKGYNVLATDMSEKAVRISCEKGLRSFCFDIITGNENELNKANLVYADGLMGHVWDPQKGFLTFFKKIYRLLLNDGLVILSNDLCDACHKKGSLKVDADSTAMFFKPNKGYVAAQAINTGLFKVCFENIYSYDRVGRGVKVREILILKSLTPIDGNYCRTTG